MKLKICVFFLQYVGNTCQEIHGHGHAHDGPGAGHGHAHAHHGHSHDHGASHGHAHDHGHAHHGHDQKPPSFKYSREANVKDVPVKPVEPPKTAKPKVEEHEHDHETHKTVKREVETPVEFNLWLTAIGSTVLISLAPIVILLLIPLDKGPAHENFLKTLLSFASGGLLGDAFLHLIPHALMAHDSTVDVHHDHDHASSSHNHGHSHGDGGSHSHDMRVGLWILSGIVAFLAVEKLVRILKNEKHGHSHSVAASDKKKVEQHGDTKKDAPPKKETKESGIKVAAYLNLAADFTHNFTDGLAIGASYLVSRNVGMITTLTILLHEVPHEIGDFAILIQSGCSKRKAMFLQVATAAGAVSGTLCSLMAEGAGELATSWILPFTAGGFIYIATVAVIPELLGDAKLWQSVKEICAMLVGILMMVFIAQIE